LGDRAGLQPEADEKLGQERIVTLVIIGGGLTGTSMLCQFVRQAHAFLKLRQGTPASVHVHVVEKQDFFGPGFPHSHQNAMPFHLINMCARDMSILAADPEDFERWVNLHINDMDSRFPGILDNGASPDRDCHHYPRPVMGEYLKTRFSQAVNEAKRIGIRVHLHPGCEAIDVSESGEDRVRVTVLNLGSHERRVHHADRVLLATGHWFYQRQRDGYFPSPWPPDLLQENIPGGSDVAIIGTSLSAIDAVLTLTADGDFRQSHSGELLYQPSLNPRRLFLYSRKALLPTVRGRTGPYRNQFMVRDKIQALIHEKGWLRLEELFDLLNRDLQNAYGRPFPWREVTNPQGTTKELLETHIHDARHGDGPDGDIVWQTLLQQTFPMVRDIYLALAPAERMRLDGEFNTLFFVHAAPMPIRNAEKLLALMNAGMVTVRKQIGETPFRRDELSFSFTFQDANGEAMEATHPYVVDARGQSPSYATNHQTLAVNLLRSGTVEIEPRDRNIQALEDERSKPSRGRPPLVRNERGGLWIDPRTHRVRRTRADEGIEVSERITAVGAMTRGQIIDASMAHGSAVSTDVVAREWVDYVFS